MKLYVIPAIAALALAGCAAKPIDWSIKTPAEISAAATIRHDKFSNSKTVFGPHISVKNGNFMVTDSHEYYISSIISYKTNEIVAYGLVVYNKYEASEWRFYDSLIFMGGDRREPNSKERKVLSCKSGYLCGYLESLTFILLPRDMAAGQENGMAFRIDGRAGVPGAELSIPKGYIQALVTRSQNELAKGPI